MINQPSLVSDLENIIKIIAFKKVIQPISISIFYLQQLYRQFSQFTLLTSSQPTMSSSKVLLDNINLDDNIENPPKNYDETFQLSINYLRLHFQQNSNDDPVIHRFRKVVQRIRTIKQLLNNIQGNSQFFGQMHHSKILLITYACSYILESKCIGLQFVRFWKNNQILAALMFKQFQKKDRDRIIQEVQINYKQMRNYIRHLQRNLSTKDKEIQLHQLIWKSEKNNKNQTKNNQMQVYQKFEMKFIYKSIKFVQKVFSSDQNSIHQIVQQNSDKIKCQLNQERSLNTIKQREDINFPHTKAFECIQSEGGMDIPFVNNKNISILRQKKQKQRQLYSLIVPYEYIHIPISYWNGMQECRPIDCYNSFLLQAEVTCDQLYTFCMDLQDLPKIAQKKTIDLAKYRNVVAYELRCLKEQLSLIIIILNEYDIIRHNKTQQDIINTRRSINVIKKKLIQTFRF